MAAIPVNNYSLISCNPSTYPDITNLCWVFVHPMNGQIVVIDALPTPNFTETYTLTFIGQNVILCAGWIPDLLVATVQNCTPSDDVFAYENCETKEVRKFLFPATSPILNVIRIDGECDCWDFLGDDSVADESVTNFAEFATCDACLEARAAEVCAFGERTLSFAIKATTPVQPPIDRGFDKCCYTQLALADLSDSKSYKNDFTGEFYKRQTPNDTVDFLLKDMDTMVEVALNDGTYGEFQPFGGPQSDLSFYIVDWRKVLSVLGIGTYQIKKEIGVAGLPPVDIFSNSIVLKKFSIEAADLTVRIESEMDGLLVKEDVNFKNTGYRTSIRLKGFFGNNNPKFEQELLFKNDYDTVQVTMSKENEYRFYASQLPECIVVHLLDHIIFGNVIRISDYNKNNPSYLYELTPVKLVGNDGFTYTNTHRGVTINLKFTDQFQNNRKTNCD